MRLYAAPARPEELPTLMAAGTSQAASRIQMNRNVGQSEEPLHESIPLPVETGCDRMKGR